MARKSKKSKSSVKVNFKGVESRKTPPEGDYVLEILEANAGKSGNNNDQIEFILEISRGKYKGTKLYFYCPLQENSLWKLHAFLTALGEDVPEDEMDIDLSDLVGKEIVGVLTHETYQGKKRAKMTDFDSLENYKGGDEDEDEDEDDDDDDDDKSSKKSSKKSKKSKDDDDDEDDEPKKGKKSKKSSKDDDEDDDDDDDEPKKGKSKKSSKKSSKDEDEDDDDDEPKGKKSSKKKAKKVSKEDVEDMDEDELEELIEKHDLDVDLDDYSKLKKKVAAVIEALEDEDLLEDDDDD